MLTIIGPAGGEREKALALYNTLTQEQKSEIPQQLRVWLRYRSEKYFWRTSDLAGEEPPLAKVAQGS